MNRDSLAYNKPIILFQTENDSWQEAASFKCYYCGVNMQVPCKKHAFNCPNYCGNSVPVGDGVSALLLMVLGYLLVKSIFRR